MNMRYRVSLQKGGVCGDARTLAELGTGAEAAGATWWQEWIPPGDFATMRADIARGQLRIE